MGKVCTIVCLVGILLLGNKLRTYSYSSVPRPSETADEYSFGWLGISLIKDRYPIAWSGIAAYKNHDFKKINVDGIFTEDPTRPYFSIDKPWFDHPPLFGVLIGGYAYIKGVRNFEDASVIILRRPMLKIGLLTTFLIFILGSILYDTKVALLSALLYSVIPTTVISSRLALAENGYIPLYLASLIFAIGYVNKRKTFYWTIASIIASISLLFKLSGITAVISLFLIAFLYGKKDTKKLLGITTAFFTLSLLAFFSYGAYFGWDTFVKVFTTNVGRFYGASSEVVYSAIVHPKITSERFLTDGWIIFGWIASLSISFGEWRRKKGGTIITIALTSYLLVFIIFGSESYGWYRFVFYPFLLISMARFIEKLFVNPNFFVFTTLMFLPFGTSVHRLIGVEGFQNYVLPIRIFSIFSLVLFSISLLRKDRALNVQRIYMIVILLLVLWLSVKEIFFYSIDKWFFVT